MLTSLKKKLGRSTPTAGSASPVGAVASPAAVTPSSDVALPKRERRCVCVYVALGYGLSVHFSSVGDLFLLLKSWLACIYRRSSIIREEKVAALKDLPQLKDTPITKREVRANHFYRLLVGLFWRCSPVSWSSPLYVRNFTSPLYHLRMQQLFKQKLELCCVIFNFDSVSSDKRCVVLCRSCLTTVSLAIPTDSLSIRGKELKRVTLLELVDYVNSAGGQKVWCCGSLFRSLGSADCVCATFACRFSRILSFQTSLR